MTHSLPPLPPGGCPRGRRYLARLVDRDYLSVKTVDRLKLAWSVFALALCVWTATLAAQEAGRSTSTGDLLHRGKLQVDTFWCVHCLA